MGEPEPGVEGVGEAAGEQHAERCAYWEEGRGGHVVPHNVGEPGGQGPPHTPQQVEPVPAHGACHRERAGHHDAPPVPGYTGHHCRGPAVEEEQAHVLVPPVVVTRGRAQ